MMFTNRIDLILWLRTRPTVQTADGPYYVRLESLDKDWFQMWFALRLQRERPTSVVIDPPKTSEGTPHTRKASADPSENYRFFWIVCRWLPWHPQRDELVRWLAAESGHLRQEHVGSRLP